MKHISYLLGLSVFFSCQSAPSFDVLITNATIYDGSGNAPIAGEIGIHADTVAAIGNLEATGKVIIDAHGMAAAPGFINMLSWANVALLEDGRSQSDIRQGVTLEVMGEGSSMGPLSEEMKTEMLEEAR